MRAAESSRTEVGATDVVLESRAPRTAVSEEQGHALRCHRVWSIALCGHQAPMERHRLWRKRMRSRRLSVKNYDLKPSASSASEVMKLWSWKRRTPLGR